jgi:hypothetical protein
MRRRLAAWFVILLAVGVIASGCGGSDSRVSKLEGRVAKLEAENVRLKKEVGSSSLVSKLEGRVAKLEAENVRLKNEVEKGIRAQLQFVLEYTGKLGKLDRRTRANDEALYRGVSAAQYDIYCGPNPQPGCHVPLGLPGSVYTSGEPGRIFATPYP